MSWSWVVIITALITFCNVIAYRRGFIRGSRAGAMMVLDEWRDVLNSSSDVIDITGSKK